MAATRVILTAPVETVEDEIENLEEVEEYNEMAATRVMTSAEKRVVLINATDSDYSRVWRLVKMYTETYMQPGMPYRDRRSSALYHVEDDPSQTAEIWHTSNRHLTIFFACSQPR